MIAKNLQATAMMAFLRVHKNFADRGCIGSGALKRLRQVAPLP
jgi:hypothetical protein